MNTRYEDYKSRTQKAADLYNSAALLQWDQEVYMPPKSAAIRGRQLATLTELAHEQLTCDAYGALLHALIEDGSLAENERVNVQLSLEDYDKNKKLSPEFVNSLTQQSSICFESWQRARKSNDFSLFAPDLDKMIILKRKQAELYGYEAHPYDSLLDDYEKGATVALLDTVFDGVKKELPALIDKIRNAKQVDDSFFSGHYDKEKQFAFSMQILEAMGYDLEAGRQDYSAHPFTTSFSPEDVRVTTRVNEADISSLLWSSVHEGGHALYEQGLPVSEYGLPLAQPASLSVHESQSRLWENCVGRGEEFWQFFFPSLQELFPEQLKTISAPQFFKASNKVQPSLIRTEADELTYHFHVMIRYDIEKMLMEGMIHTKDLPALWNEQYQKYLGITPPDDAHGVLQDVHWSHGSFGYFPTYSLGSFYAAQLMEQAEKDVENLAGQIAAGNLRPLLDWLRRHIHQYGRKYRSEELVRKATGRGLDFTSFMNYATQKYKSIYELS